MRRNAATHSAIPATTVTTTMTTMLVPRSSDPIPPLELPDAVLDGLRPVVGFPVSNVRLMVSLRVLVSVIRISDDDSALRVAGRSSGFPVVLVAELVVVAVRLEDTSVVLGSVLASLRPGVRGCVSSMVRSASTHRIWIAGPTVTTAPAVVASRAKPHTPPRKSVMSVVQVKPLGTQYTAISPGAMVGNPSSVLVLLMPQLGPTTKPSGQMAGE
jgi:hypothetical protein